MAAKESEKERKKNQRQIESEKIESDPAGDRENGGRKKSREASAGDRFSGLERDLSNRFKTGG